MRKRFQTAFVASFGMAFVSLVLQAGAAPVITVPPKALIVNAGSTATFSVTATDAGSLSYQWLFKGTNLVNETNATLLIENVATNQAGAYSVKITANDGQKTTTPVALTVSQGTIVRFALATGNVDVELFDHDKPVTVQNFLHYFEKGLYTNTFFHRLEPGFVLQGGGYSTPDRGTNDFCPTNNIWDIYQSASYTGYYVQIVNEFGCGPRVRNDAGTLSMARVADTNGVIFTNSASSQWFFNLADNSTNLDNVSGGFTVFGRVIQGWDVLAGFNNFSTNNGITDLSSAWPTNGGSYFSTLPYQTSGGAFPRNADLFYANMSLLTKQPALDKALPAMAVTYPRPNAHLTNGNFTLTGIAKDSVGVALVDLWLRYYAPPGGLDTLHQIEVTGTTNWSAIAVNHDGSPSLAPGAYLAAFRVWDGAGNLSYCNVPFYVGTTIQVNTVGQGSATPNYNGKNLDTWPFAYPVTAVPKPGWLFYSWSDGTDTIYKAKCTFSPTANMTLTATFLPNYFTNVNVFGRYDGLFCQSNNATVGSAGYITISPTRTGAYSGYVLVGGLRGAVAGQFDATGNSQLTVKLAGSTNTVTLALSMDLTNNTETISGTASGTGWSSDLVAHRGVTKLATNTVPAPGKYVLRLPADPSQPDQPAGDGYLTVTAGATGLLTVSGTLPDGSAVSESVVVSKDGKWPIYASLNSGKGLLYGWESFSTNCAGQLQWVRPGVTNTYYTNSFSAQLNSAGNAYVAPARNASYQMVFSGGVLDTPVTNLLTASSTGLLTVSGKPANQFKMAMTAVGAFNGTFTNAAASKPLSFKGAFENAQQGGYGYFVAPSGQVGGVEVTPVAQ